MADLPDYYTQAQISEAEAAHFKGGLDANKSATPISRDIYLATDTHVLYVCFVDGTWTGFDASILTQGILTLFANLAGGGFQLKNIADPTAAQDASTRAYVLAGLANYLALAGGTMSGAIAMGSQKITGLAAGTQAGDALRYEQLVALYLLLTGGTMSGPIAMGANKITGLAAATVAGDAARYEQVPTIVRKTANETVNNSAVLQNDNHLLLAIAANEVWDIKLVIIATLRTQSDWKGAWSIPAGCSGYWKRTEDVPSDVAQSLDGTLTYDELGNDNTHYQTFEAIVINGATAGNLQFQWAQNTQFAENTIVKANSYLIAHKIA